MKNIFMAAVVGLSAIGFNAAAHGPAKAEHGGVVQTANDRSFELVKRPTAHRFMWSTMTTPPMSAR